MFLSEVLEDFQFIMREMYSSLYNTLSKCVLCDFGRCLRTGAENTEENCIMRSLIIFTLYQILVR
jgi:hypothetical protein